MRVSQSLSVDDIGWIGLCLVATLAGCRGSSSLSGFQMAAERARSPNEMSGRRVRPTSHTTHQLRLMTYNVFLRPNPVGWGDATECRGRQIGAMLDRRAELLDVVALNETFARPALDNLLQALGDELPYRILRQPEATFPHVNGGLTLLSRHPIEAYAARTFDTCHGADCFAEKGFVHAIVKPSPTSKLNVVATHLDAGEERDDRRARRRQMEDIHTYLEASSAVERWPTVLLGDMNVDGLAEPRGAEAPSFRTTEYRQMLGQLELSYDDCSASRRGTCHRAPVDVFRRARGSWSWRESDTRAVNTRNCPAHSLGDCRDPVGRPDWKKRKRLDYIFAFDSPTSARRVDVRRARHLPVESDACDTTYLSDHRAISADLRLRSPSDLSYGWTAYRASRQAGSGGHQSTDADSPSMERSSSSVSSRDSSVSGNMAGPTVFPWTNSQP